MYEDTHQSRHGLSYPHATPVVLTYSMWESDKSLSLPDILSPHLKNADGQPAIYLAPKSVEEIKVNGYKKIFCKYKGLLSM